MQILISSTNQGKVQEITQIIQDMSLTDIEIETIGQYVIPEPEEPYHTFLENAIHKAKYYAKATGKIALADDSGLCIEALGGFPGVKTKDFSYECGGLAATFVKLEEMLSSSQNYAAYLCTAVAIYFPETDEVVIHEGMDAGRLSFPAKGAEGFGFDPVFIRDGFNNTIAELGVGFKNSNSHRSKALKGLLAQLSERVYGE